MENQLTAGMIITGPMFPEPVRVISLTAIGTNRTKIEAVGTKTERYYSPILPNFELDLLQSASLTSIDFSGDPEQAFLYLEGLRIRNAYQFDPLYGVSVSRIDPLPHQIEAVYYYILANPRIRFLLADDPGAGKTIMAGLLLKELKYRGLVQRALIIVPGHLKEQWLREMKERFGESFLVVDRAVLNASWGQNAWKENSQIITSLDFAKQDDVRQQLKDSRWDLVIVDEAHKMAAYQYGEKVDKTIRYRFGEDISRIAKHLLFLTATPHRGDPENFRLLLDLLEPGFFANTKMLQASIENRDNPLYLRRLKEDLRDFDGKPLFPPRQVHTLEFPLSPDEKELYEAVTEYVRDNFNRALQKEQRNVAFALTILQRRLASSLRAIRRSLERRRDRLQDLYQRGLLLTEGSGSWDEDRLEDLEDEARTAQEQELMEKLTSAGTLEELAGEIRILEGLCALARQAERKENETKLVHLRELIEDQRLRQTETKLLLFTESRDTMEYLAEKLRAWGYVVATIHGGLSMDQRIAAEHHFRDRAQMLVATEAAGEGINLQFCWLMVNYDIPWNPNRLEQRMGRIHRYGQRHEVHIYNLIAADTREGQVFSALFRKLEVMRAQLGSDRIFDVIGDVLPPGTTLKEMLLDAIAHKRTMEEILATLEYSPNEEALARVRQISQEALATRHLDLSRILGDQRAARENRLVPEYVEGFFQRAAHQLSLRLERRQDSFWRLEAVPGAIRRQPHEFKLRFGTVQESYLKFAFDKEQARRGDAEFVTMGHPLMEGVLEAIFRSAKPEVERGATFLDPDGRRDGLLWFFAGEVKDGSGELAGRRLFCLYEAKEDLQPVNPSLLWDFKPTLAEPASPQPLPPERQAQAARFALEKLLVPYQEELLIARARDARIKQKYGVESLEMSIGESEAKLIDYETRREQGEMMPDVTLANERHNREQLEEKLRRLREEILAETHLYPTEPRVLAVLRVIPAPAGGEMTSDAEIERIGMERAMAYERSKGRDPEDVSAQALGYDVRSRDPADSFRYIEVKARARAGAIALTPNEWLMAHRMSTDYWLYVVEEAATEPALYLLQNPAAVLKPEQEVSIVRFIVRDWKEKAERA